MAFNLGIDYKQKRWLLLLTLAFFCLSFLPFTKDTLASWNNEVILGVVKVGTIVALVGIYLIWEVYKKRT